MRLLFLLIFLSLVGCISQDSGIRVHYAESIARKSGFDSVIIPAGIFNLQSFQRSSGKGADKLVIYIEGDGYAWISPSRQSLDPTPKNPLALKLALLDDRPNVIYLGRPCQYLKCSDILENRRYWGSHRFSKEVLHAYMLAIDLIKDRNGAKSINLVGFSGGGAIALLLSAKRLDINNVVTVAGNLNTSFFANYHAISPLLESENPSNYSYEVEHIPQIHFVGVDDVIVPRILIDSYVSHLSNNKCVKVVEIQASHYLEWEAIWPDLHALEPDCYQANIN